MKTEIEKLAKAFAGQVVKIVHKSIADSIGGSSEDEQPQVETDAKPAKAKRKYTRKAKTASNAETPAASASAAEVAG